MERADLGSAQLSREPSAADDGDLVAVFREPYAAAEEQKRGRWLEGTGDLADSENQHFLLLFYACINQLLWEFSK